MRRVHAVLTPVLAALALAGCGAEADPSADRFQGAERAVAEVVDDIASAARGGDGEEICTRLVTAELAEELAAGNTCEDEVGKALSDASDFDIQVRDVTVSGTTATAQVRGGEDGTTATFEFERGGGGWRASALGGS